MTTIIRTRTARTHALVIPRDLLALANQGAIHLSHVLPLALAHFAAVHCKSPRNFYRPITEPYVLGALISLEGGGVWDTGGHAAERLYDHTHGISRTQLRSVLIDMDKAGLVSRKMHQGGRATDHIAITDAGRAIINNQPPGPVPAFWLPGYEPGGVYRPGRGEDEIISDLKQDMPELMVAGENGRDPEPGVVQTPAAADGDLDHTALARLCLHLGVERDEWREKYAKAEENIDDLVRRLNDAAVEIERLRKVARNADASVHGAYPLRESLRAEERTQLDRLMRELPAT